MPDFRADGVNKTTLGTAAAAIAALAAIALYLYWPRTPPAPVPLPAPAASAAAPEPVASVAAAPQEPAALHPIEAPEAATPMAPTDIATALTDLVGRKAVATFFQTDDFARRLVATVDNLGRGHAAPMLWPINPTAGRFTAQLRDGTSEIALDNSMRYTPFVLLVETIDIGHAVDLYVRMYPLLQQAYQDLGYPKRYFNDRVIAVIDILLATPDVPGPVQVELPEIKGPIPSERPWVRYQFADPALESLTSGQKMLLRTGPVNQRRLKAKLSEIRQQLTARAKAR